MTGTTTTQRTIITSVLEDKEWDPSWTNPDEVIVEVQETPSQFANGTSNPNITSVEEGPKVVVRPEEAAIVIFVLVLWVGAIALFFNRWGKIRMLEPYQPKFQQEHRVSCPLIDLDTLTPVNHRASIAKMSMGMSTMSSTYGFPRPYVDVHTRPRQNSVFVGAQIFSPPQPARKTRSAFDIHSMILSEGEAEAV